MATDPKADQTLDSGYWYRQYVLRKDDWEADAPDRQINDVRQSAIQHGAHPSGDVEFLGAEARGATLVVLNYRVPVVDAALPAPFEVTHVRVAQEADVKKGSGKGHEEDLARPVIEGPSSSEVNLDAHNKAQAKAAGGDESAGKKVTPDDEFVDIPDTKPRTGPEKAQAKEAAKTARSSAKANEGGGS